ncbi:MAG: NAD-dependent epimerase/dehydratase family protein [Christensenellaceae bacterium]|jgi:dihydroflavonol-4-reductase|nr:NAD-dependent epimerase/dehydratase family protein [Christensenellaceae bacterium]
MKDNDIHIVTGAAGRTGFPLCLELIKRGAKVRALDIVENEATEQLKALGCEVVYCDVTNPHNIDQAFGGGTFVYHLAGIVSIESKPTKLLEEVNIKGTQNVIDGCLRHNIKRLIHTGSVHMLETDNKTGIIMEPNRFNPDTVYGGYAKSKAIAANLVLDAKEKGLDVVLVLPSGIIGPYEFTNSNFGEMVAQVADGNLRIFIKGKYDFVDVRDLACAFCDLAQKGENGQSYIVSGNVITVKEMMNIVAETAGIKRIKHFVPLFLVKMFAGIAEKHALRKKRKPTFTPYSMKVLQDNCNFSHARLTKLTGYTPRPVEESLKDHTKFYMAQKAKITDNKSKGSIVLLKSSPAQNILK